MAAQTATATQTQADPQPAPDLAALKTRQQAAWSSGNYAIVGSTLQIVGEELCEALDLKAGSKVLDVAAGNGMATLAAARRWCDVTSTDYVPALLERGQARATAEGYAGRIQRGRCGKPAVRRRQLRGGALYLRRHVHAEPGPRGCRTAAGLQAEGADWPRELDAGRFYRTGLQDAGRYLPPPAGAKSPALWGTRARLTEMFDAEARSIKAESRLFKFRYRSAEHFLDVFKTYYGPVLKAFAALDPAKQEELHNDLNALIVRMNRSGDSTMVVPSEYLEVVITKR